MKSDRREERGKEMGEKGRKGEEGGRGEGKKEAEKGVERRGGRGGRREGTGKDELQRLEGGDGTQSSRVYQQHSEAVTCLTPSSLPPGDDWAG